jgi:hypothetical protein
MGDRTPRATGLCRFFSARNVPSKEEIRPYQRLPIRYSTSLAHRPISNRLGIPGSKSCGTGRQRASTESFSRLLFRFTRRSLLRLLDNLRTWLWWLLGAYHAGLPGECAQRRADCLCSSLHNLPDARFRLLYSFLSRCHGYLSLLLLIPCISRRGVTSRVPRSRAKFQSDSLLFQNAGVLALLPSGRPGARSRVLGEWH